MNAHTPGTGPDWDDEAGLLEQLGKGLGMDPERTPPADRIGAVRDAAQRMNAERDSAAYDDTVVGLTPRPARRFLLAGGVAAGFAGVAGYFARDLVGEPAPSEDGPAIEQVAFTGDATVASAGLINHTWGTELLLDVSGLRAGTTYDVVYRTTQRDEVAAGSLLAVDGPVMKCRFNAAPLRADVRAIVVRARGGRTVLAAELPTVTT